MDEYGIHEAPADVVVADHAELNAANRALEGDMLAAAAKADVAQRTQTWQEAFHIHKRAIFWSMALSGA
jgi:SP family general alpha glucoside:H+ symporter-like MFS transporter